jgi:hypothetical protein
MIATIALAILSFAAAAAVVNRWSAGRLGATFAAQVLLLGVSLPALILYLLSAIGIPWSRGSLAVSLGAILLLCMIRRPASEFSWPDGSRFAIADRRLAAVIDLLTVVVLCGYLFLATAAPTPEYDFIGIWGLKGRVFSLHGAIDWEFLTRPENDFVHPDYPILLPLMFASLTVSLGEWRPELLGVLYPIFALAGLLAARSTIEAAVSRRTTAALATLGLTGIACSPWIGLAEAPLVAFTTVGLLLMREGALGRNVRILGAGALFIGLAGLVKNEGVALVVSVALAALLTVRPKRSLLVLLIPLLVTATWLVPRRLFFHLQTHVTAPGVLERALQHLSEPEKYLSILARYPTGKPLLWIGILIALVLVAKPLLRSERFALLTLALQYLALLGAYVVTPHDLDWHLRWSWDRVVNQLTLPLVTVVLIYLLPMAENLLRPRPPAADRVEV